MLGHFYDSFKKRPVNPKSCKDYIIYFTDKGDVKIADYSSSDEEVMEIFNRGYRSIEQFRFYKDPLRDDRLVMFAFDISSLTDLYKMIDHEILKRQLLLANRLKSSVLWREKISSLSEKGGKENR